mmetsp:Transcript_23724/g.53798  ORF Transcript_23724/g.53798 Transcript_23724/m.53798 type:complete len:167 (-) Transcript_23724:91-591(-)
MSVLPPVIAAVGGGIPSAIFGVLPAINPYKALLGSVFLYNSAHMVKLTLHLTASKGVLNNDNPRAHADQIIASDKKYGPIMARCNAAHNNGLESFPVFAAGVLACELAGVDKTTVGKLCTFHLLTRVAFNVFYMGFADNTAGAARTVVWVLSLVSSCQLIGMAARK